MPKTHISRHQLLTGVLAFVVMLSLGFYLQEYTVRYLEHALAATCGDGRVEGTEECDDGGVANGDGCSSFCTEESGWTCSESCTPDELYFPGDEATFNAQFADRIATTALDSTTTFTAYMDSGNSDFAVGVVGTVSGDDVTYGTEAIISDYPSVSTSGIVADALDSTHVVIAYYEQVLGGEESSVQCKVVIGEVSGTSVTYGTPVEFAAVPTGCSEMSIAALSSSKFVITYLRSNGMAVIGDVSGTTITLGTPQQFNSYAIYTAVAGLDSTHFIVGYRDYGDSYHGNSVVGEVSGTTITFGSEVSFTTNSATAMQATALDSSHVVFVYYDLTTNPTGGHVIVGTIAGTSVSYGMAVAMTAQSDSYGPATLTSTSFVIGYQDFLDSNKGKAVVGTIANGDEITLASPVQFNGWTAGDVGRQEIQIAAMDSDTIAIAYVDRDSNTGNAIVGQIPSACPSACMTTCGNGIQEGTEACDDGNTDNGDGCSSICIVESGYTCSSDFTSTASWDTYDPGANGVGTDPDGYTWGTSTGGYIYFAPYDNGSTIHGEVLRYNVSGSFDNALSWETYDPGANGLGVHPDGYMGAIYDDRYIYFVPNMYCCWYGHDEVLRYDTQGDFSTFSSWTSYSPSSDGVGASGLGFRDAVSDGRYIYFVPYNGGYNNATKHGQVLRYDTQGDFVTSASWTAYDPGDNGVGTDPDGYAGGIYDGRYVYFVPQDNGTAIHGEFLRYDTQGTFDTTGSWTTYDPGANGVGSNPDGYMGSAYDGQYIYFVPYENNGEVMRYDTLGSFNSTDSWVAFDPGSNGVGTDPDGFWGATFDGRYVYFVPYYNGSAFHGEVLRYDTYETFADANSWTTYDPGSNGVGSDPDGFRGGIYKAPFVYFVPHYNGTEWDGEVMRYGGSQSICETYCGDGIQVGDEECDDGNTENGDGCSSICEIEAFPDTIQLHFRWSNDSYALNSTDVGRWLESEDTAVTDATDSTDYRLRVAVANTGDAAESAARTYKLQYGINVTTCSDIVEIAWLDVPSGLSTVFLLNDTTQFTHGDATQALLANSEAYSFLAGQGLDTSNTSGSIGPMSSEAYTEIEYSIETFGIAADTTYCFRLYDATAGAALDTYSQYPQMTVAGPETDQLHFRWRSDDDAGLNADEDWLAVEDTAIADVVQGDTYRIRMEVANTGGTPEAAARTYKIQYGQKSTTCAAIGSWTDVDTSNAFEMSDSANFSNGDATTAVLTNSESYTFTAGKGQDTGNTTASIGPINPSAYTEIEYSITPTTSASASTSYCFRLYDTTAGAVLDTYTQYPSLTIGASNTSQLHFRWRDDTTALNTDGGWLAVEDAAITDAKRTEEYRIRFEVANTGDAQETAARTYRLEYAEKSTICSDIGTWFPVIIPGEDFVELFNSSFITNGESVTPGLLTNAEGYA
ncbi:MAG: myxococcus cysteine-rich repeat containing protein, partial [Candidatus Absconditabacterales bacterium]